MRHLTLCSRHRRLWRQSQLVQWPPPLRLLCSGLPLPLPLNLSPCQAQFRIRLSYLSISVIPHCHRTSRASFSPLCKSHLQARLSSLGLSADELALLNSSEYSTSSASLYTEIDLTTPRGALSRCAETPPVPLTFVSGMKLENENYKIKLQLAGNYPSISFGR